MVEKPKSVSKVVASLNKRSEIFVKAIVEIEEMVLLERRIEKNRSRGRPMMLASATDLDRHYFDPVARDPGCDLSIHYIPLLEIYYHWY